jgi:hypothetical protein
MPASVVDTEKIKGQATPTRWLRHLSEIAAVAPPPLPAILRNNGDADRESGYPHGHFVLSHLSPAAQPQN